MSKEPPTPQAGGEPPSRARGANAAPSQRPGTRRSHHASERQAMQAALHDGAGTSAAMAAHGGHERHVRLQLTTQEGGQVLQQPGQSQERAYRGQEYPPGHGGAGVMRQPTAGRPRPSYVPPSHRRRDQPPPYAAPPSQRRQEQPPPYAAPPSRPAIEQPPVHGPHPLGGVPEGRLATPLPPAGAPPGGGSIPIPGEDAPPGGGSLPIPGQDAPPRRKLFRKRKETRTTTFWPSDPPVAHSHTPGETVPPVGGSLATPGGADPTYGGSATAPGGPPRGRIGVPTAKTIERVSTLEFGPLVGGSPPPLSRPPWQEHDAYPHPQPQQQQQMEEYPRMTPTTGPLAKLHGQSRAHEGPSPGKKGRPSPLLLPERKKKRRPVAFCFTLCCILFWLLVVGIGIAILVVYLLYHPQPPRLRVTTATLNAGYVDQLPPPRGGLALNSDLYVLATIYNPNTKVDVVMRYMQLDLFFHGVMIGTQAVWPPIHEEPGESAIRSVHLVVSEVRMPQEDAEVWRNATTRGGLVELKLRAKFNVQLNFGRWLPFRYWVYPTCSLWLDPPPGGALRRARCRK